MLLGRSSTLLALLAGIAATSTVVGCSSTSSDGDSNAAADTQTVIDATPLITLSPNLPFEVKRMHPASGPILSAHWGAHGGPEATTSDSTTPTVAPTITRWFIPAVANAPAGQQPLRAMLPPSMPTTRFFWDNDGFTDLSFGGAFMSYTGPGGATNFQGEILLYAKGYDTVKSRGFVNGFYAGVEIPNGSTSRLVYSGLSGVTATAAPETHEGGLWSTDISDTGIGTQPSTKLFGWTGSSGPVASDADGNVFVAAFIGGAPDATHNDEIYALSKKQSLALEAQTQATILDTTVSGTRSLALASVPGSGKGWMFTKGWDSDTTLPVVARAYSSSNDTVAAAGDAITDAIKVVDPATSISVFGDPKGNLWVAVDAAAGGWLIELEPKAP